MCGLDSSYLKRKISTLSSGEKKLVQFAVALLCNPKVLILDEPFANLDYTNKKKIISLIKLLKERYNKTIIISSNDTNILFELADNVVILANDTAIVNGPCDELLSSPELLHKYNIAVPDIIEFTYLARKKNNKIRYQKDIRDLIKDVYKHV
jgi:ABC-type multidrug transport system ATPase subunit